MFAKLFIVLFACLSMVLAGPEPVPEAKPEPAVVSTYHGVPLLRSLGAYNGVPLTYSTYGAPSAVVHSSFGSPAIVNPYAAHVLV